MIFWKKPIQDAFIATPHMWVTMIVTGVVIILTIAYPEPEQTKKTSQPEDAQPEEKISNQVPKQPTAPTQTVDSLILEQVMVDLKQQKLKLEAQPTTDENGHIEILGKSYTLTIKTVKQETLPEPPLSSPIAKPEPNQPTSPEASNGIKAVMEGLARGGNQ